MKKTILLIWISVIFTCILHGQPLHIADLSYPTNLFLFKNKLYFTSSVTNNGNNEMWVYDNSIPISTSNPQIVIDMDSSSTSGTYPRFYTEYNGKLFFTNNVGLYSYIDTLPLSQTNPRYICPTASGLKVYDDKLFFEVPSNSYRTIWIFNDNFPVNDTNPRILIPQDLNPIITSNYFIPFVFQNKLFFSATDTTNTGEELWVYDITNQVSSLNPLMLANINTNNSGTSNNNGSRPSDFIEYKNFLYFSANDGTGKELWCYNSSTPPFKVFDIDPNPYGGIASYKTIYNDTLYFAGHNNQFGTELWKYDGENNPSLVTDINIGSNSSIPSNLKVFGNRLIFNADNGEYGRELWCYYNAQAIPNVNPFLITDLNPGLPDGIVVNGQNNGYIQYGNLLYFGGRGNNSYGGLWALTLCDINAAPEPSFTLGNDTTINTGDTILLIGPTQMTSYIWSNNSNSHQYIFIGEANNIGENIISLSTIDSNSCSYSDTIKITVIDASIIVTPKNNLTNFTIFPNPAKKRVHIIASCIIDEIIVSNLLGEKVFHSIPNQNNISFNIKKAGIYFVTVIFGNQTVTQKLIIF